MKKILMSLFTIAIVCVLITGGTIAWFNDSETSTGNTFTAGSLDLTLNGNNATNTVVFTVGNMAPGNQPKASIACANIGTINGKLNITSIVVTNAENGILAPEAAAGDVTPAIGELQDVVNIRLVVDRAPVTGWIGAEDTTLYNGLVSGLPGSLTFDEPLGAGATVSILILLDWWPTGIDDLAMSDSMTLDFTFGLSQ